MRVLCVRLLSVRSLSQYILVTISLFYERPVSLSTAQHLLAGPSLFTVRPLALHWSLPPPPSFSMLDGMHQYSKNAREIKEVLLCKLLRSVQKGEVLYTEIRLLL